MAGGRLMQDPTSYGISFVSLPGMAAIEVIDPIERHRYRLETPADVTPAQIETDDFHFPVDRAVSIETSRLTLPSVVASYIRTRDGTVVEEIEQEMSCSLSHDQYIIELCTPVKIYLELDGAIAIKAGQESMGFDFDGSTSVAIGARSVHRKPEATVTTTEDPLDMMRAVSTFGSALKTTSPERSFPTLRGHPPRIEIGDEVDIPDELAPPDTGITIELRPTLEHVFTVAPLAYYLGATIEPGPQNAIRVDGEIVRYLGIDETFTQTVEETLKHAFLLDCVTRTEGLYPVDLDERRQLERRSGLDFEALYELPIGERLQQYLSIPYDHIEDIVPSWGSAAHFETDPQHVELLPYVVNDLALVQVHDPTELERPESPTNVLNTGPDEAQALTRSAGATTMSTEGYVKPPQTDCVDQLWIGEGTPIGASKAIPEAFEHRLELTPTSKDIDITVICNDNRMNEERGLINEIYGSREDVDFDITIHQNVTREELTDILADQSDFLHYIGHIDDEGFDCVDGKLDLSGVEEIGVSAFLLNACQSYTQGRRLIEGGGIGGIVTLSDVINEGAIRMGKTLAQLLNLGFPLYAALRIAKQESLMGARYTIVGDGRVSLTQAQSVPILANIEQSAATTDLGIITYPSSRFDVGSMIHPLLSQNSRYFLVSQNIVFQNLDSKELNEFLKIEHMPVRVDGELTWSSDLSEL